MEKFKDRKIIKLLKKSPEDGIKMVIDVYGSAVNTICKNILINLNSEDIENIDEIYEVIRSYANSIDFNRNDIRNLDIKQKIWFFMARISLKYSCKIRNSLKVGL